MLNLDEQTEICALIVVWKLVLYTGGIVLAIIIIFKAKHHPGVEPVKLSGKTSYCHYVSQSCKILVENDSPYFTSYIVYTQKTRQT